MCGIVGYVSPHRVERERLCRATDSLEKRGPDGRGLFWDLEDRVGLGHRRLAIVDPAGGQQPLPNEDQTLWAAVNGEFYGEALLRTDLEKRGHRFASASDSEIILHLYEEHELDFVHHLRGEFALLLWDARRQRMVAARDHFGIKPLLYACLGDELWLASRARALFAAGVPARWDPKAFAQASATQYVGPESTWFAAVRQLPPAHILVHEEGQMKVRRYWEPPLRLPSTDRDSDQVHNFAHLLEDCVSERLPSDHAPAFQLSGGLDSASVLALARKQLGQVDAFTVSFDSPTFDESALAEEIASHCGARLHIVRANRALLLDSLTEAVAWSEGLAVNAHLSGKFLLSRAVREAGFKVVLTGEGADEVLLGYPHYRKDVDPGASLLGDNLASAGIMLSDSQGLDLSGVQNALGQVPTFMRAKAALGRRLRSVMHPFPEVDHFLDATHGLDLRRSPVERAAWLWNRSALANYILHTLGDGCEMAHSVEGRLPFLDVRIAEATARLPLDLKIRQGLEKYVLRQAVRPLIPHSLYLRKKHPFMAPPLGRPLVDRLREASAGDHPFIDRRTLRRRLDTMDQLSEEERREWEPALTWLLTSYYLQSAFRLTSV